MTNNIEPQDHAIAVTPVDEDPEELRANAVKRLHERRGLMAHALAYVMVNALLVAIWVAIGSRGFFWPLLPIFGWGIGLAFHAWGVFWPEPGEAQIDREMERIRRQHL
jgi:hypothetical protein